MKEIMQDFTFILNDDERVKKITMKFDAISSLSITNNAGNQGYFSLKDIDHKIRGVIENMTGVLLERKTREKIIKLLRKNKSLAPHYMNRFSDNGWYSIFTHMIDVKLLNPEVFGDSKRFNDLHKRLMRRPNTGTHLSGCESKTKFIVELQKQIAEIEVEGEKNKYKLKNLRFVNPDKYAHLFENNPKDLIPNKSEVITIKEFSGVPPFYKGVYDRENILLNDTIFIELNVSQKFYDFFYEKYKNSQLRNDLYLGDSNSLINVTEIKFN